MGGDGDVAMGAKDFEGMSELRLFAELEETLEKSDMYLGDCTVKDER